MKYLIMLLLIVLIVLSNCQNVSDEELPTTLEQCKTYEDTIYVLDFHCYENGLLKPPCSLSPDYAGCIQARLDDLECKEEDE